MTGFRVSASGWYGLDGVAGDLYTFGKVMSGGLPAAAFGGSAEHHGAPGARGARSTRRARCPGTPSRWPRGSPRCGPPTPSVYAALDANAARLGDMIDKALAAEGVPHRVQFAGNLLSVFFTEDEVHDYAGAQAAATWRFPAFFHALLERGVYAPPSAFEAWFVSAALDDDCFGVLESALPVRGRGRRGA